MVVKLARAFLTEAARAAFFSFVVAGVFGVIGFGLWSADFSLVQADVTGTATSVLLASVLPAFFGAWLFFLLRKIAWSGPAEAFATGGVTAGLAVLAHRNVLTSRFFDLDEAGASEWVGAALGLLPRSGAVDGMLLAEIGVVLGVGVCALLVQHFIATR